MKKKRIELTISEINYIKDLLRDYSQEIYESDMLDEEDLSVELEVIENLIKN